MTGATHARLQHASAENPWHWALSTLFTVDLVPFAFSQIPFLRRQRSVGVGVVSGITKRFHCPHLIPQLFGFFSFMSSSLPVSPLVSSGCFDSLFPGTFFFFFFFSLSLN